jgi:hypothetical protein
MTKPHITPVEDTVPKVAGELAVGENLEFQRRWWTFERIIWSIFLLIVVFDLLGGLGHGWLAQAKAATAGGALTLDYERIERANTPSTMTLHFGPAAIRDGRIQVFVSNSVVQELGAQRIAPQPAVSSVGEDGISYTFPASVSPAEIQIQLQPSDVGLHRFRVRIPQVAAIEARVLVLP